MLSSLVVGVGLWSSLMVIVRLMCFAAAGLGQGACLKKASMVFAGLISVNVDAIVALLEGDCGLKEASRYWD